MITVTHVYTTVDRNYNVIAEDRRAVVLPRLVSLVAHEVGPFEFTGVESGAATFWTGDAEVLGDGNVELHTIEVRGYDRPDEVEELVSVIANTF